MPRAKNGERRQEILEALAHMLEKHEGKPITTAALAKKLGVSEAALYRHFPSKAKMFEALIVFIEETLFSRMNMIMEEEKNTERRVLQIMTLLLGFADRNPGITRLMQGDVLVGEAPKLRDRIVQLFDRIETQFKQILREGEASGDFVNSVNDCARLLMAVTQGHIFDFVRTSYRKSPMDGWDRQWLLLRQSLFR